MSNRAFPKFNHALRNRSGARVELCPTGAADMVRQGPVIARPAGCTRCAQCDTIYSRDAIACACEMV